MSSWKAQFVERLVQALSHICARPLQKNDKPIWQLKSRSGGKKNFCFFQISISLNTVSLKRLTTVLPLHPVHCQWLSTVSRPKCFGSQFEDREIRFWCVLVFGKKKTSRRCPIFSHSLTNMSAFLFKHPGESTSKCQGLRMRPTRGHSKRSQADEGNMLLLPNVTKDHIVLVSIM